MKMMAAVLDACGKQEESMFDNFEQLIESIYKRESKYNLTVSETGEFDPTVIEKVTNPVVGARSHPDHLMKTRDCKQFESLNIFPRNCVGSVDVLHNCDGSVEDLYVISETCMKITIEEKNSRELQGIKTQRCYWNFAQDIAVECG
jgi:hypothetical protein